MPYKNKEKCFDFVLLGVIILSTSLTRLIHDSNLYLLIAGAQLGAIVALVAVIIFKMVTGHKKKNND